MILAPVEDIDLPHADGAPPESTEASLNYAIQPYNESYFDEMDRMSWCRRDITLGRMERDFLALLNASPNDRILDVGCGTGWHISHYGNKAMEVVGLDISRVGLVRAVSRLKEREAYSNVSLVAGLGEQLPFRDERFDKLLCVGVIEHLEKPGRFLQEARKVLRRHGSIVLVTINAWDPIQRGLEFLSLFTKRRLPLIGRPDHTHKHLFSLPELKKLLAENGFHTEEVRVQYSAIIFKTFGGDLVVRARKL